MFRQRTVEMRQLIEIQSFSTIQIQLCLLYSSPPLKWMPLLPNNSVLVTCIRDVSFGESVLYKNDLYENTNTSTLSYI